MSRAKKLAAALSEKRIGAVVVFKHGTTYEEAISILNNVPSIDFVQTTVQDFDPSHGKPVFYIP